MDIKMTRQDWAWVLTCFGTAVGAGILFLPIQASKSGIWPMVLLTLIIYPITYVAHRGITRIVASCSKQTDIIGAVEMDVGHGASFGVSILYFLSIISICIGYATGVTKQVQLFMEDQMGMGTGAVNRPILCAVLLLVFMVVLLYGEKMMVRVTTAVTFPLIGLLFFLSLYMIPHWNSSIFSQAADGVTIVKHVFLLFPVLVFAMNFSPVCSTLGAAYRRDYPDTLQAVGHSDKVIKWTSLILLIFVMLFVFSMTFSTTPETLKFADENNTDILTSVGHMLEKPWIHTLMPIVAFLAIVSSYFGHFTGTREGIFGIYTNIRDWNTPMEERKPITKGQVMAVTVGLTAFLWVMAIWDPKILNIIAMISAPVIAMYAYLMPVILMRRVPRLAIYRSKWAAFVFVMGLVGIVGGILNEFMK